MREVSSPSDPAPATPAFAPQALLAFGPFLLDRAAGRLLRDDQPVNLAPKPWALLCFLVERPGRLVSKDELLDALWGHRFVSESALKVTVNGLRQALGEDAREAQWVQTVPRRGYRFHEAVRALDAAAPKARPEGTASAAGPSSAPSSAPASTPSSAPSSASPSAASPAPSPGDAAAAAPASASAPAPGPGAVPRADPAPAAASPRRGNLPLPTGPLIGREAVLARLKPALLEHRLITLVGPGGIGKTRLALAAAGHAEPADGAWLVRLEDFDRPEALPSGIARALQLGEAAGRSPEALARALAPLAVRVLLDNAEHLVDALAPQVAQWLAQAPDLSVLVSSQRPLQIGAERLWPVEPLALPADPADPDALRDSPAVALMLQLVQRQRPGWSPGAADLAELGAIATALEGMPLALELAAARVPLIGAAGVRQRLDARLQMLTGGRHDAPQRHRTLRASLDWSCSLLAPPALLALCRLSVFVGGFTADSAQAVLAPALPDTDEWDRLDLLAQLQELALLARPEAPSAPAATQGEVPRLRLLDGVRLYGLERLQQQQALAAAQDAHRQWVLQRILQAEQAYFEMGVERWLTPLEPELQNLVAAMTRGLQRLKPPDEEAPDAAVPAWTDELASELALLAAASTSFCLRTGLGPSLKQWRDRLQALVQARGFTLPPAVQARWCLGGAMLGGIGLVPIREALQLALQAVDGLSGSPQRRQLALYVSGLYQQRLGQTEALADTLAQMRAMPEAAAASPHVRKLRPLLEASAAQARGDRATYLAFWTGELAASRARGDRYEAWRAAWGVGEGHFLQGRVDEAIAVMDEAVTEIEASGRLASQSGFASQAVLIRLARNADPVTMARLRGIVPLLRSQGTFFAALGDALAWVPLWQGRIGDARRVQAWADARITAQGLLRTHVAKLLRERFSARIAELAGADAPTEAGADPHLEPPTDEDAVLHLVLGPGPVGRPMQGRT